MKRPLTAVICLEYDSSGAPGYVAHCMELGIASQGDTIEEARLMLQEAVEGFLEVASSAEVERRLEEGGHAVALMELNTAALQEPERIAA
jgi:predicted RNase H-like HicB family nuclease